jgi:hypothetical protein
VGPHEAGVGLGRAAAHLSPQVLEALLLEAQQLRLPVYHPRCRGGRSASG